MGWGRRRVHKAVRVWGARRRGPEATRELGGAEELEHWERHLATPASQWPEEFVVRTNPTAPLQDVVRDVAGTPTGGTVRILDVGAGPLTWLGTQWPQRSVEITAIDALAREYDALLARLGVAPVVRTLPVRAEELGSHFAAGSFDIAHARDSLDHTADPARVIVHMAGLTRPGGAIVLQHLRDAAELDAYTALRQWNLRLDGSTFTLWRPGERHDVVALLGPSWSLERGSTACDWDVVVLRRFG